MNRQDSRVLYDKLTLELGLSKEEADRFLSELSRGIVNAQKK